ncbi:MAG: oligoendopeptidase F, partial [Halieaceae bacterium]|nr:oligoendopeptidase F [Halieaceae bacterium]
MSLSNVLRHLVAISLMTLATLMSPLSVAAEDVPERSEIADQYKWDLADLYVDASAWEADKAKLIALLPGIADFRGKLGRDGNSLLAAIEAIQAIETIVANLYVYAGLKNFEDTRISDNAARFSEAQGLYSEFQQALAFFSPELLSIPEATLDHYVASTPGLALYEHYLDETARMRAYTLSEVEEKLLAMASDPLSKFDSVFTAIDSSDLQFGRIVDEAGVEVELTTSRYGAFLHSTDRRVRKAAWTQLFEGYQTLNHTLAANYEGHVKSRVFFARARGFDSRLQQATYTNAIP